MSSAQLPLLTNDHTPAQGSLRHPITAPCLQRLSTQPSKDTFPAVEEATHSPRERECPPGPLEMLQQSSQPAYTLGRARDSRFSCAQYPPAVGTSHKRIQLVCDTGRSWVSCHLSHTKGILSPLGVTECGREPKVPFCVLNMGDQADLVQGFLSKGQHHRGRAQSKTGVRRVRLG